MKQWLLSIFLLLSSCDLALAELYFMPEQSGEVLGKQHEIVSEAKSYINVMAFGFTTGNPLIEDLVDACRRGVKVRVYRDVGQAAQKLSIAADQAILDAGCEVRLKPHRLPIMHTKSIDADGKVLWGSYNFSKSGPGQDNVEEYLLDPDGDFKAAFERRWKGGRVP